MGCVEVPSRRHGSEAYIPASPDATVDDSWPPASREIAIERARRQRLEKGGLAIDDATLECVADAVMDPGYRLHGLYYTAEERADDEEVSEALGAAVEGYLRRFPEIDGGVRFGWRDGQRTLYVGLVGDARAHEVELRRIADDRVAFERVQRRESEREALADRILADEPSLLAAGFEVIAAWIEPRRGVVEVELVGGRDAAAGARYFDGRYCDAVAGEWLRPSRMRGVRP